jgi:bifunctional ADP-heptose synthase (sugar kinase/adenylyltransferase)
VVEAYGGRVCFLPLHEGRSTTAMLQRAEQLR